MTLGSKIERARKARKLSLDALGKKLGVSRQLVWQWERDETDPRKHIEKLSLVLEVPVEYFYGPNGSDSPLDAKIKRLNPVHRDLIETMVDKMLGQQDEKPVPAPKRA